MFFGHDLYLVLLPAHPYRLCFSDRLQEVCKRACIDAIPHGRADKYYKDLLQGRCDEAGHEPMLLDIDVDLPPRAKRGRAAAPRAGSVALSALPASGSRWGAN